MRLAFVRAADWLQGMHIHLFEELGVENILERGSVMQFKYTEPVTSLPAV